MQEITLEQKLSLIKYRYEILSRQCSIKRKKCLIRNRTRQIMEGGRSLHHIFPKSRNNSRPFNTVYIAQVLHDRYHLLFENKDPYQILDWLVRYFWGGKIELIKKYIEQYENKSNSNKLP